MEFSSIYYIAFLIFSALAYYLLPERFRRSALILFSLFFVASGGLTGLSILLCSVVVNYYLGIGISNTETLKPGSDINELLLDPKKRKDMRFDTVFTLFQEAKKAVTGIEEEEDFENPV